MHANGEESLRPCALPIYFGFGLFAPQQRRTAAAGREPLVTPRLLRKPAFTVGLGGIALFRRRPVLDLGQRSRRAGGGHRRRHGDRHPVQLHLAAVDDEIECASGVLSAVQAVGGSIGVEVFGSVFFARAKAIDAAVAEAALRQHRPLAMLASDIDDMVELCGDRVRLVAV
ncbi:hypothetical protein AB0L74_03325 [Streptomyces sp. NPDC052020]|uniref:hypothetical protein n=1 Tax=Streptomyces sp. NPDC052020 TaxID=3155677 RepID=UPI003426AF67